MVADEWGRIRAAFEFCIREALRDLTQMRKFTGISIVNSEMKEETGLCLKLENTYIYIGFEWSKEKESYVETYRVGS